MPEEWSAWVLESSDALRVGRVMRALTGTSLVATVAILVLTLATGEPFHHPAWVLLPGIPVLVGGQLWAIAVLLSRGQVGVPPAARKWRIRSAAASERKFFFAGLPRGQTNVFLALVLIAGLAADAASTFIHSAAAPQRFAASVFMAFYAIQTGVSSAELARRRQTEHAAARGMPDPFR